MSSRRWQWHRHLKTKLIELHLLSIGKKYFPLVQCNMKFEEHEMYIFRFFNKNVAIADVDVVAAMHVHKLHCGDARTQALLL